MATALQRLLWAILAAASKLQDLQQTPPPCSLQLASVLFRTKTETVLCSSSKPREHWKEKKK